MQKGGHMNIRHGGPRFGHRFGPRFGPRRGPRYRVFLTETGGIIFAVTISCIILGVIIFAIIRGSERFKNKEKNTKNYVY